MSKKNVFLSILGVLILAGGVVAGVMLVRKQQELREKAAVPGGQARVSLFPTTGNLKVGDNVPVSVYFNTSGVSISSVNLRLVYPFSGINPEVTTSDIEFNPVIEQSGNWNCPTKSVTTEGQNIAIDLECANISAQGYSTNTDTLFATFKLTVVRIPQTNPFSLKFDPSTSMITQKSTGQDILSIPDKESGTAVFTVETPAGPSPTPTPTKSVTQSPTGKITPTPTKKPTATPTRISTPTPTKVVTTSPSGTLTVTPTIKITSTPTSSVELPNAGYSAPTFIGLGLGLILIIVAILLAV
jgi:hypothetical protein